MNTGSQRLVALLGSIVVHLLAVGVLVMGLALPNRRIEPKMPVAIQATVVTQDQLSALRERETEQAREEAIERRQAEAEQQQREQAQRQQREEAERRQREQAEREQRQQAEADADRRRREREQQERELLAEQQKQLEALQRQREQARQEVERQKQDLAELEAQRRAQEQARARELEEQRRQQMIDLESQQLAAAEEASLEAQWVAIIQALVTQNWRRPPTAPTGTTCMVRVDQLPGGDVVNALVLPGCRADEITRRSIIDAVMRSEPLPYKGFESVFRRQLTFEFVVTEP